MQVTLDDLETLYPASLRQQTWNIDHATGMWLAKFVQDHDCSNILEIGTSIGVSTSYLALSTPTCTVTTVESYPKRYDIAQENFAKLGVDTIISIQGHAPRCLATLPTDYDLVFLDCIKLYYKELAEYCIAHYPNLKYIIADNTISHGKKLADFAELCNNYTTEQITIGSGMTVIRL
jgi:predicted O-methyltransferase YrrM